jgi:tripartite-type tricarboxylate transporter receptor subunit TctC
MEGRVQVLFQSISGAVTDLAKTGRMKPLAVTGQERVAAFPELPTLREAGVDVATTGWFGLLLPARVPQRIVDKLEAAAEQVMAEPEVKARISAAAASPAPRGLRPSPSSVAEETERMRAIVQGFRRHG